MIKILILFALLFNHSFLLAQQATLVEVDKIIIEELNQTVPIIGSIESKKDSQLMAAVQGKVDKIFVSEGNIVKKGQILAKIDYNYYKFMYEIANANVEKAKALHEGSLLEVESNNLDLNIMKALKKSPAFNSAKLEKLTKLDLILKAKEKVALSELKVSYNRQNIAKLDLEKSTVKAAFSGIIEELFIEEGEVANIGSPLFKLIDKNSLEILAEIPTSRAINLKLNTKINLYTTDNIKFYGNIKAIGSVENKKTRTTKVFLDFKYINKENKRRLLPGESINVLVPIGFGNRKLTIHKDAILKNQGMSLAYVVLDNKVEIRPLKLGEAVGSRFIVIKGLKKNDIVVTKGNERLRPGQSVSIKNKL